MRLTTLHKAVGAHDDGVWAAAWVPGSNKLLTGSVDESVKSWEEAPDSLKMAHHYTGHTLGVVSLAVDPTGTFAASSSLDSLIRVWNLHDHSTRALMESATTETWAIALGPEQSDGSLICASAGGTRGSVVIWRVADETSVMNELLLPVSGRSRSRLGPLGCRSWPLGGPISA